MDVVIVSLSFRVIQFLKLFNNKINLNKVIKMCRLSRFAHSQRVRDCMFSYQGFVISPMYAHFCI